MPEGLGIKLDLKERATYEGWFKEAEMTGVGRWIRRNEQHYLGEFVKNKRVG